MFELDFNSVRLRLTLWYVGFLTVVLIAFSAGVYGLLANAAYEEVDRQLTTAIEDLERSLQHEVEEHFADASGERAFTAVVNSVYRDAFPSLALAVYRGDREIARKPGPYGYVPPEPPHEEHALHLEEVTVHLDGKATPGRQACARVSIPNYGEYEFVAVTSLAAADRELSDLRRIVFFAVPLAIFVAAIGSFLLARKSLAPVVAMSETADQISSSALEHRIPVQNPKDELGQLAGTFNRLLDRLEASFARQKQFMADSSHELRTPLFVAHTAAQVILDRESRPENEYREALAAIDDQIKRLNQIVDAMFVLARADAGNYPIHFTDFYLEDVVSECGRAAKLLATPRGITVQLPTLEELACRGDEGLIRQLLMNLLDNAIKYTSPSGTVSVTVNDRDRERYAIDVSDTGPGIPVEAQARIFERFYRADKSRTRAEKLGGAGLGLAIATWIAEMHGGALTLVKSDASGSTFRATFLRTPEKPSPAKVAPAAGQTS